ncbi:MAG TPA: alpha/beta fold hydrolase [Burkholderiales bacterium]|nr:alpha/beta fold hydrolase [Burkholderiales bacterium]
MIAVHTVGEGPDLFMLPGWGMHRGMWGDLPVRLAEVSRTHACELPGYGDNQGVVPILDDLVDELSKRAPPKLDVLGWSLGGMLAMLWALRYPAQVRRLVLIGSTPSFIVRENWRMGTPAEVLGNFSIALRVDPDSLMENFMRGMSEGEEAPEEMNAKLRALFANYPRASKDALSAGLEWLRDIDLREALRHMEQKVLLVHGEKDVITSVAASRRMAKLFPNVRLKIVDACGHAPHLSHTPQVCAVIRQFLHE